MDIEKLYEMQHHSDVALQQALEAIEDRLEKEPDSGELWLAQQAISRELELREISELDPRRVEFERDLERQLMAL